MINGTIVGGVTTLSPLGLDGGGWVTGIDIAADGYMVCRNDTADAHVRGPNDTSWRALFKPGITYPTANQLYLNPAYRCYEICIAPSNSLILYASCMGRLWKTTDRTNWTLLTGFKSNAVDITMSYAQSERVGGQKMRVSPTVPANLGFCHPVDGFYYSTDSGTTWTLNAVILAPTTTVGGSMYFVSDTDVWVTMGGRGTYHSTTGVNGTFALVTGGPTQASSISGGGGNVYFIGDNRNVADSQLFMWNGTAFSQPTGVVGYAVAVNPSLTSKVVAQSLSGNFWVSADTGATWSNTTTTRSKICHDVPYLSYVSSTYMSLGAMVYHRSLDQVICTNGIGVFTLLNPPLSGTNNLISITLGIRNMLVQAVVTTPLGKVLVPVQDKAGFVFTYANAKQQASRQAPDGTVTLRQGGGMDYARDDENYLVMVYAGGSGASVSTDGGVNWTAFPTLPTYSLSGGAPGPFFVGNIAVSNKPNFLWVSSSNWSTNTIGGVKYTTDGGTTWNAPVFGASVSMLSASWHPAYTYKRLIVQASKDTNGVYYIFCNGTGVGDAGDLAQLGMWKSTNYGANFTKIRAGHFNNASIDQYHSKLRLVPGRPGHMFWAPGPVGSYPTQSSALALSIFFTTNDWVTEAQITGFSAPNDIAIGAKAYPGQLYQTLYVEGWRGAVSGLWRSTDFDPANPTAATWQLQETWLLGRADDCNMLAADQTIFGRVYVGIEYAAGGGGGGAVGDNIDLATGT